MGNSISPIIEASELLFLQKEKDIILIDASGGNDAKNNYTTNHLTGALFVDLDKQLAALPVNPAIGGRHPLPSLQEFSNTLTALGITPTSHVIVYDDKKGGNAAARFWWMLKSIGHQNVQVLNGGYQEAVKVGLPVSSEIKTPNKVSAYPVENWHLPQVDINQVALVSENKDYIVVDVRDQPRYNGDTEPIDLIAGHIPGAVNIPFMSNLNQDGLFLSATELKEKYQKHFEGISEDHVIVHCGSGVTACHTLLAIAYAGMEIPNLYVGSWSEWSRNDKPIATNKK